MKKSVVLSFMFIILIILNTESFAGSQKWNSLDYDVTLNLDGSMDVIETWNIDISETNTLFKTFEISNLDKYLITDVKVSRVENNIEENLTEIYEQQYHVNNGCYYALEIDDSNFEIAWNVGLNNSSDSRIYKMYYTVKNAVSIHNDCTELYWQFLSNNNSIGGKNVTGTIRLPKEVSDIQKLRVWGHGPLTAIITKESTNRVSFLLDKLNSKEMLEIRIVTEENIYENATNMTHKYKLENILTEEQKWADEANAQRKEVKKEVIIFIAINIIVSLIVSVKIKKYKAISKQLKNKYSSPKETKLKYFREIPDEENATPAIASYLYNFKGAESYIETKKSKIFSATILDICLKDLVKFEVVNDKEVRIFLVTQNQEYIDRLQEDEKIVYNLLKDAIEKKDYITPKEFSKYASKNYEKIYEELEKIEDIVEKILKESGKISLEKLEIYNKWYYKTMIYNFLFIIFPVLLGFSSSLYFSLPTVQIAFGVLAFFSSRNSVSLSSVLTEKGIEERMQWKGLKKYMKDFSLLNEKSVPDITLWEKYLVYATTFGISEKVIEQFEVIYPEVFVENANDRLNKIGYWHIISNPQLGPVLFNNLNKGLENVYKKVATTYSRKSGGSGSGGGFSGGGGGRRWRWKLWWSLNMSLNSFAKNKIFA